MKFSYTFRLSMPSISHFHILEIERSQTLMSMNHIIIYVIIFALI
jgi:hypothetical protein